MKNVLSLLLAVGSFIATNALAADEIVGVWHTAQDKSQVQIFKSNGRYFGRIISLKDPSWPANDELGQGGKPKTDRRNPNHSLRGRLIVGLQLMNDFEAAGKDRWDGGKVYDPESGKTYKGKITLVNPNRLELRGYVGVSLFGRTEVWTR